MSIAENGDAIPCSYNDALPPVGNIKTQTLPNISTWENIPKKRVFFAKVQQKTPSSKANAAFASTKNILRRMPNLSVTHLHRRHFKEADPQMRLHPKSTQGKIRLKTQTVGKANQAQTQPKKAKMRQNKLLMNKGDNVGFAVFTTGCAVLLLFKRARL